MTPYTWFGISMIAVLISFPFWLSLFVDRNRTMARKVAKLLVDGRPAGCKCPQNPVANALPSDNRHINSPRCPITKNKPVASRLMGDVAD